MKEILTLNKIAKCGTDRFDSAKYVCTDKAEDPAAIMVRSASMHEMQFGAGLLAIARAGAGVNNIPIDRCSEQGIAVFNTPGANANAVKELVICAALLASRKVVDAIDWCKTLKGEGDNVGKLVEKGKSSFAGPEIKGKTMGVVGMGAIGKLVAEAARDLGMRVVCFDRKGRSEISGVEIVDDMETVFSAADYLTLHIPCNDSTRNIINAESIGKMKDGVRIVNCARGGCVDTEALAAALKSGKVAGAAIDVYPEEPLTPENNPFIGMPQVVQTPHLGASTIEAQIGVAVDVAYGVIDALEGRPVMTAVNMAPIPKSVASVIAPYFKLAERLGTIGIYLAEGPIKAVEIEYTGELAATETQALTTAFLKGLLNPILQDSVNFVNAPGIAKKRHLQVRDVKSHRTGYFSTAINVKIVTEKGEHTLTGTLFAGKEAKIVQIDRFRLDFKPEGYLLLAPHLDKPNMIGQIATVLGSAGININGMQVGSTAIEGTNLMAIATSGDIPNDIMLKLRGIEGIIDVKLINCEG